MEQMGQFLTFNRKTVGLACATTLLAFGCSTTPTPPPVKDVNPITRTATTGKTPDGTVHKTKEVTRVLLARADAAGDTDDAIALLERAIRIEPRNPKLWISLSAAHLKNKNTKAAEQHAQKAIALSAHDAALTRQAWLQLAHVFDATGRPVEANSIRRQYRNLQG